MLYGTCGDQAIRHGHRTTFAAQVCKKIRPDNSRFAIEVEKAKLSDPGFNPLRQPRPPTSGRKCKDSGVQFRDNDRVDDEIALVNTKPIDYRGGWPRLGGLAQNVGIDEKLHPPLLNSEDFVC